MRKRAEPDADGLYPERLSRQFLQLRPRGASACPRLQGGARMQGLARRLFSRFQSGIQVHEIAEIHRMVSERHAEIIQRWLEHGRGGN